MASIDTFIDNVVITPDTSDLKDPVDTSTEGLGNITLSGEQTLNGVATSGSRVIVVEQTNGEDNGPYLTSAGAWTRSARADSDAKVTSGLRLIVTDSGSTKFLTEYVLTTSDPIILGTTVLTFSALPVLGTHAIGGSDHTASTLAALNSKISDATVVDTGDARFSDARVPLSHALGGSEHSASTLAALNALVSDATLIDTADARLSDARTPTAHTHDGDTLQLDGVNSDGGTFSFTTTGAVTFNQVVTVGDGSLLATSAAPTTDAMIANKKYVDDNVAGAGSSITDADADTGIQAEANADEDIIRILRGTNDKLNIGCPFTDVGINALIDSLGAEGGLGILPEGSYVMSGNVTVDQSNTVLQGTGAGSIMDSFALSGTIIHIDLTGGQDKCEVSHLAFLGNDGAGDSEVFISASASDDLKIFNNFFTDSDNEDVRVNNSNRYKIAFNTSKNPDGTSFIFPLSSGLFLGNTTSDALTGGSWTSGSNIIALNFEIGNSTGFILNGDDSIVIGNLGNSQGVGFNSTNLSNSVIVSNTQRSPSGNAYQFTGSDHLTFVGNSATLAGGIGVQFTGGGNNIAIGSNMVTLAGNTFDDFVLDGFNNCTLIGNIGAGAAARAERGLRLNNSDSNVIIGQMFTAHDTAGMLISGDSDNNIIMFNHLDGESVARIVNTSSGVNNII